VVCCLVCAAILSGCQNAGGRIQASLDSEFSLAVGQTAELRGEQLTIQFVEVQGDSRCPRGATCIWQGQVSSVLQISADADSARIVLTEPGLSDRYGKGTYKEYEITSHVLPYPEMGRKIASGEYRLLLTVRRIPQGNN
jgi:hypothetical protein